MEVLLERIVEETGLAGGELGCAAPDALGEVFENFGCKGLPIFASEHEVKVVFDGELANEMLPQEDQQIH